MLQISRGCIECEAVAVEILACFIEEINSCIRVFPFAIVFVKRACELDGIIAVCKSFRYYVFNRLP